MREFGRRYSELGRNSELGKKNEEISVEELARKTDELRRQIDEFVELTKDTDDKKIDREAIYGIDQETVRKEETREFNLNSPQNSSTDEDENNRLIEEVLRSLERTRKSAEEAQARINGISGSSSRTSDHDDELSRMIDDLPMMDDNDNSKHI